jgi:protein-L-isoaspartate(D-aspartate) O-methyltransferase
MVELIHARGVKDENVLAAMRTIPRHLFVEQAFEDQAYSDYPLPIGQKQTISQPFMVGFMTAALELKKNEKVLEVGTGSGYQAAILSLLVDRVYTVERIADLARKARRLFDQLRLVNVNLRVTDGTFGWEEQSPFDAIMVTAGAPEIPANYLEQLADGGRMVIPVGDRDSQSLKKVTRTGADFVTETLLDCRFVPLIGKKGWDLPDN